MSPAATCVGVAVCIMLALLLGIAWEGGTGMPAACEIEAREVQSCMRHPETTDPLSDCGAELGTALACLEDER